MAEKKTAQQRVAEAQAQLSSAMGAPLPDKETQEVRDTLAGLAEQMAGLAQAVHGALQMAQAQNARVERMEQAIVKMHSVMAEFHAVLQEIAGLRRGA